MFASKVDRFRSSATPDEAYHNQQLTSNRSNDSRERIEMGVLSKNAQRSMLLLNDYKGSDGDTARIFRK
jgi:hypothetical protein